jgi:hypothetical protein
MLCFSTDWKWCCREANAKAQRLLRFSQGNESSDAVSQPNGGRVSGKAEHRFPSRQVNQSPKPAVDGAPNDTMETEALGEDFGNAEAIVGTCDDMCSGDSLPLVSTFLIQSLSVVLAYGRCLSVVKTALFLLTVQKT